MPPRRRRRRIANRWNSKEPPALLPVSIAPRMLQRYNPTDQYPPLGFSPSDDPSKPPTDQPTAFEQTFSRPPIFDILFSCLSPASLVRFARTCRLARTAISIFSTRAFNINKHLLRFISDPIGFRSLQARTGTLISGSNALQFLDRTFYPDSDLDLYTHPGHTREVGSWLIHREGYQFVPFIDEEPSDFDALDWRWLDDVRRLTPRADVNWDMHVHKYRTNGLLAVLTFRKPSPSGGPPLQVQVMAATHAPLQCILNFHSTCVMNFISFDAAYSLYPHATFEDRLALWFSTYTESDHAALTKYTSRGFSPLTNTTTTRTTSFHTSTHRFPTDALTWVLPLDTTGLSPRPPLSPASPPFLWDPVRYNSWVLLRDSDTGSASHYYVAYHTLRHAPFRYTYLFADIELLRSMRDFLIERGQDGDRAWWDAVLPAYVLRYLAPDVAQTPDPSWSIL